MQEEVIRILRETGALIPDSHFVGVSGRHFDTYVNKDALLTHPAAASRIGELFAEANADIDPDAVIAPAMGAIILGQWTAYHLGKKNGREILSVYTDKGEGDAQVLKRGYGAVLAGKKVLAIEDVTTTGGSVAKTVECAQNAGGEVLRVSVVMNKSPESVGETSIGVPFKALAEMTVDTYAAEDCPLCKAGVPVNTSVGHGKKFVESERKA